MWSLTKELDLPFHAQGGTQPGHNSDGHTHRCFVESDQPADDLNGTELTSDEAPAGSQATEELGTAEGKRPDYKEGKLADTFTGQIQEKVTRWSGKCHRRLTRVSAGGSQSESSAQEGTWT